MVKYIFSLCARFPAVVFTKCSYYTIFSRQSLKNDAAFPSFFAAKHEFFHGVGHRVLVAGTEAHGEKERGWQGDEG